MFYAYILYTSWGLCMHITHFNLILEVNFISTPTFSLIIPTFFSTFSERKSPSLSPSLRYLINFRSLKAMDFPLELREINRLVKFPLNLSPQEFPWTNCDKRLFVWLFWKPFIGNQFLHSTNSYVFYLYIFYSKYGFTISYGFS